jgi:hypothetical protein
MCDSSAFDAPALTNRDRWSNCVYEPARSAYRGVPPGLPARGHCHDNPPPRRTTPAKADAQEIVNRSLALPLCPSVAWPSTSPGTRAV